MKIAWGISARGFGLIGIIIAFVLLSSISTAVIYTLTTSSYNSINELNNNRAYYLAESGIRYVKYKKLSAGTYTYTLSEGDIYVTINSSTGTSSKGTVAKGTQLQAIRILNDSYTGPTVTPEWARKFPYIFYSPDKAISISQNSNITGTIYGYGITIDQNSTINGDIISKSSSNEVKINQNAIINGNVCSEYNLTIDQNAVVNGSTFSKGSTALNQKSSVRGSLNSGSVSTSQDSIVALTSISIDQNANVNHVYTYKDDKGQVQALTIYDNIYYGTTKDIKSSANVDNNKVFKTSASQQNTSCDSMTAPVHTEEKYFLTTTTNATADPLSPGGYNILNKSQNNSLHLSSGNYYFESINFDQNNSLYLDLTSGAINIYVKGDVKLSQNFKVYAKSKDDTDYKQITATDFDKKLSLNVYLETLGSFTMDQNSQWLGIIFATKDIKISQKSYIIGTYFRNGNIKNEDGTYSPSGTITTDQNITAIQATE
ncbi:hypothetical protein [Solidesulfovibrio alcoholivorans]|uniref:hypothetical protein n=1 Tax=Solidesulfovibrio alcoholivorans TaxID=81406 RepID=UPI000A40EA6A|nr:hypothetical protein [Solidesulfovibrio alcoholivorans]